MQVQERVSPMDLNPMIQRAVGAHQQGHLDQAAQLYEQILQQNPRHAGALQLLGTLRGQQGRHREAVQMTEAALALSPNDFGTLANHASVLMAAGRHETALLHLDKALAIKPDFLEAHYNRGVTLAALNRLAQSLESYGRALATAPGHVPSRMRRAHLLHAMGRFTDALADYDTVLAADHGNARAWNGRGAALNGCRRNRDALASFDKAIALQPDLADALINRAHLRWSEHGDHAGAIADLSAALAADPAQPYAAGDLLHLRMQVADWTDFDVSVRAIDDGVRRGLPVIRPFAYQAIGAAPADLQACSRIFAKGLSLASSPAPAAFTHPKIRIGYISAEFREQATAYLMAGLYELHDRDRFEIIAIDNGGGDGSAMRRRLEAAFDKVLYIAGLNDDDAAALVRAAQIDILVNLNGYFGSPRMGLFARRPAAVQVNYLGFPATLGASCMDYIIADRTVIPPDEERFYDEQVVTLPHSYQANDAKRAIAHGLPSRAAMGLPDDGFVFCNFNQSYKITPASFASWMRILGQVEDSVLWLLGSRPAFAENLRREAHHHGIAPQRLIFAPNVPLDRHLSRLRLADLFLDTLPYNAHTTASDALWAGVPLVTCRGSAFAGRVAASLLGAVQLPELIAESTEGFEALAVRLATDRAALAAIRRKLAGNRLTTPLFDTDLFRRHIEAAYGEMHAIARRGAAPRGFAIEAALL